MVRWPWPSRPADVLTVMDCADDPVWRQVPFAVAGRELLAPLRLFLAPGRVHGLIGSGKSTLFEILARQWAPGGGTVRFEGRPTDGRGERAFVRRLLLEEPTPAPDIAHPGGVLALVRRLAQGDDEADMLPHPVRDEPLGYVL